MLFFLERNRDGKQDAALMSSRSGRTVRVTPRREKIERKETDHKLLLRLSLLLTPAFLSWQESGAHSIRSFSDFQVNLRFVCKDGQQKGWWEHEDKESPKEICFILVNLSFFSLGTFWLASFLFPFAIIFLASFIGSRIYIHHRVFLSLFPSSHASLLHRILDSLLDGTHNIIIISWPFRRPSWPDSNLHPETRNLAISNLNNKMTMINDASSWHRRLMFHEQEFLRSLPNCLLDTRLYSKWVEAINCENQCETRDRIKALIKKLPEENVYLLQHFLFVLKEIASKSEENKMCSRNLAVCIGPSLLQPPSTKAIFTQSTREVSSFRPLFRFIIFSPLISLTDRTSPRMYPSWSRIWSIITLNCFPSHIYSLRHRPCPRPRQFPANKVLFIQGCIGRPLTTIIICQRRVPMS